MTHSPMQPGELPPSVSDLLPPPTAQRHPATAGILRYFEHGHLPPHLADVSSQCYALARSMAAQLPDSPELTTGLRKLLEAKDCFVRAALDKAASDG